jgi:hypothetical protein
MAVCLAGWLCLALSGGGGGACWSLLSCHTFSLQLTSPHLFSLLLMKVYRMHYCMRLLVCLVWSGGSSALSGLLAGQVSVAFSGWPYV